MSKESGSDGEVAKAFEQAIATLRDTEAKLEEVAPLFASPAAITRRLFAARAAWTVQSSSESGVRCSTRRSRPPPKRARGSARSST